MLFLNSGWLLCNVFFVNFVYLCPFLNGTPVLMKWQIASPKIKTTTAGPARWMRTAARLSALLWLLVHIMMLPLTLLLKISASLPKYGLHLEYQQKSFCPDSGLNSGSQNLKHLTYQWAWGWINTESSSKLHHLGRC